MKTDTFSIGSGVAVITFGAFLIGAILRLGGYIDWPWWLITSPLWATFGTAFIAVIVVLIFLPKNGR